MSTLTVGTIAEKVTDAGVSVDGVTLKDGGATFTSAVTATDNTVDLGASSTRFKDIYLSGGAFLGGTGSANKLEDYEEGTFNLEVADADSGGNSNAISGAQSYTKIGRTVICHLHLSNINTSGMTGGNSLSIRGFPFSHSDTSSISAVLVNETNLGGNAQPIVAQLNSAGVLKLTHLLDNDANNKLNVNEFETGTADIQTTLVYRTTS